MLNTRFIEPVRQHCRYLAFFLLRYGDTDRRRAIREGLTRATGTPDYGGVVSK